MSLSDLRQTSKSAKEHRRSRDQKAKWSKGIRPLPGQPDLLDNGRGRPQRFGCEPDVQWGYRRELGNVQRSSTASNKLSMRYDVKEAIATRRDSFISDDEYAPEHPNVLYSYDATKSPAGHAEQILSVAVAKALDRFETKETEKIVREYEFVDQHTDGSEESGASAAEDDEYEFV
jgi:hypothetical protein